VATTAKHSNLFLWLKQAKLSSDAMVAIDAVLAIYVSSCIVVKT